MNKPLILVVEDDIPVRNLITITLKTHGYRYLTAGTGDGAVVEASSHNPDVVLLDLGLPDIDGSEVLERVRGFSAVPVIVISARTQEAEKVQALDQGADDYITKPFSVVVLHKRIEALQRRIQGRQQNNKWIYKDVEVDFLGFCAKKDNNPVDLKPKEIKLLELLIKHKNQVLTRNQMLDSLWEIDEAPADRVIDVYIKNLRKKLDLDCITTVKGIGYKFEDK